VVKSKLIAKQLLHAIGAVFHAIKAKMMRRGRWSSPCKAVDSGVTNSQIPSPFCAHSLTISPVRPTPFPLPSLQSQVSATATRHPTDIAQPGPSLSLPSARHRRPSLLLLQLFEMPQPQHTCASRSYAVPVSVFHSAIELSFQA
jgi:hypothetical protein